MARQVPANVAEILARLHAVSAELLRLTERQLHLSFQIADTPQERDLQERELRTILSQLAAVHTTHAQIESELRGALSAFNSDWSPRQPEPK